MQQNLSAHVWLGNPTNVAGAGNLVVHYGEKVVAAVKFNKAGHPGTNRQDYQMACTAGLT